MRPRRRGSDRPKLAGPSPGRAMHMITTLTAIGFISLTVLFVLASHYLTLMGSAQLNSPVSESILPLEQTSSQQPSNNQASSQQTSAIPPLELRPKVFVNLTDWAVRLSDDIRSVSNRASCVQSIRQAYEEEGKVQVIDPVKLRDNVLAQINILLSQHRAAVSAIVSDAEQLAMKHVFVKNLTFNYTDVHRIRNELDPPIVPQMVYDPISGQQVQQQQLTDFAGPAGSLGSSSGASGMPQFTSIGGGTPVPGPPEWQTPIKSIVMRVTKNFGDIPVNTSMSAVHLPLPIYAGQPEVMNGIAWSEKLDNVFKRNLAQFAHVHHQYYGDRLGFLRTFPAHKWRIPKLDPDLYDARTRPWYVAGTSSPKNIVILIDSSGSMTGIRREIAKGVVFEILDSLTSSDYFTVLRFSETIAPIGLPKCSNLRQPPLSIDIRRQCAQLQSGTLGAAEGASNLIGEAVNSRELSHECAIFERQQERSKQYLMDHPDLVEAKNVTYMSDEAYEQSIGNVSAEIRDAYMLPATSRNVRYLKMNFTLPTRGIANFTRAFMGAFELLQAYERTSDMGSQCNQAIMLITDGALGTHEEVFNRFNYPNSSVRLFTYMIGREVGDMKPTKAMACNNRGYFTRVINLSEVREQVLKYLNVMARPLVLAKHHPISWTSAYGDETHQVLTDWVLEIKRRERARVLLSEEKERMSDANVLIEMTNIQEYDDLPSVDELLKNRIICEDDTDNSKEMNQSLQDELDPLGYNDLSCHWTTRRADLLTSVVKPVFDNHETSLIFQRVIHKNSWSEQETMVRNAQLLGVASVDLRVADILKSIPSYLLGPNGYAILIGQNGFIMHHPDLRALLEDPFDRQSKILKPYFNAVDLSHIEQVYMKNESIESASNVNTISKVNGSPQRIDLLRLLKLREAAIRGQVGNDQLYVKRAVDCRRRPHIRQQLFYYGPVKDTPFSLMLALATNYGLNRVKATKELKPKETRRYFNPSSFELWTVHPEYKYCEGPGLVNKDNSSLHKILEVLSLSDSDMANINYHDLNAISANGGIGPTGSSTGNNKQKIFCDSELFPSLLFDAAATSSSGINSFCKGPQANCYKSESSFSFYSSSSGTDEDLCTGKPEDLRLKLANIYGLEMSFVATRSGLTRVRVNDMSSRIRKLAELFIQRHNKAIDEPWYSRTVDWNMRFNEDATVISVPYNAYIRLIAKLRQRITQRHPAPNETRANCDDDTITGYFNSSEGNLETRDNLTDSSILTTTDVLRSVLQGENAGSSEPTEAEDNTTMSIINENQAQNDEPVPPPPPPPPPTPAADGQTMDQPLPTQNKIDYSSFSAYDFLDMLTNSSVHISATQTVIANAATKQRSPVAVTGLLYDYATFARRFLNGTSLDIHNLDKEAEQQQTAAAAAAAASSTSEQTSNIKVDICPNGECPSKCGYRNDTIDCLLIDNNGYIVVGEELPYIGRSLNVYDEKLMQSLVEKHVFHQITLIDYQAICTRSAEQVAADQKAAGSNSQLMQISSPSSRDLDNHPINLMRNVLLNVAGSLLYSASVLYSMFLSKTSMDDFKSFWTGEPIHLQDFLVDAQTPNQSLIGMLPNKTYLRACEKVVHLYETRPAYEKQGGDQSNSNPNGKKKLSIKSPEYYESKCNCSAWYVYEQVPKTNLLILIVNTTSSCRRCDQATNQQQSTMLDPTSFGSPAGSNFVPVNPPTVEQNGVSISGIFSSQTQSSPSGNMSSSWGSNKTAEDQVCAMLERDSNLYVMRTPPEACYAYNEKEFQIPLCGGALSSRVVDNLLLMSTILVSLFLLNVRRVL